MENPFDNPTTLRDPNHFGGRQYQLERIFGLLRNRQSVSLVGPRRIGKTSLLTCLQDTEVQQRYAFENEHFLFLYLDIQQHSFKANASFFDSVLLTLKQYSQNLGYTVPSVSDKNNEFDALLDAFKQHDLYPVLLMDTFDEITNYPGIQEATFGFLRAEGNIGRISYVTASVKPLGEIFQELFPPERRRSISAPFYNIFASIRLSSLSSREAQALLQKNSTSGGLPFHNEEIEWTIKMAGTHPFFLQQVAALLFEEKRAYGDAQVDYASIRHEALQILSSHFEDSWISLGNNDRQLLRETIAKLEKRAFEDQGESRIFSELYQSELFRDYLRSKGYIAALPPMDISKVDTNEFKEILQSFDDPGKLGTSALMSVPFIMTRIEQQQAASPMERGVIIQEALREALEYIGGQGQRSDTANDWLHYNILYYRYFLRNHGMSYEQIAHRLRISERQYYRVSLKALDRLLAALTTMEATAALNAEIPRKEKMISNVS